MRKLEHLSVIRLVTEADEGEEYDDCIEEAIAICIEERRNVEFSVDGNTYSVFFNALLDCSVPHDCDNVYERDNDIDKIPRVIDASQLQPGDVFTPLSLIPRYYVGEDDPISMSKTDVLRIDGSLGPMGTDYNYEWKGNYMLVRGPLEVLLASRRKEADDDRNNDQVG